MRKVGNRKNCGEKERDEGLMIDAKVNVNGDINDAKSAVVSVFDHGLLFGDGVYETLRTYNRRVFLVHRHLARLRASAEALGIPIAITDAEFIARIDATIQKVVTQKEHYIRILHTRGIGDLSYDPAACAEPTTIIIVKPHLENPLDLVASGISIILSSILRNHRLSINPKIKSNNLLNNVLAMQEAIRAGAHEALMKNQRGEISECAQSNFFLVRDGRVLTPSLESGLLEGVTRNFIFELGKEVGISIRETVLNDNDLAKAEEMFITSTTREILPVTKIDNRSIGSNGPGQLTMALARAFRKKVTELSSL